MKRLLVTLCAIVVALSVPPPQAPGVALGAWREDAVGTWSQVSSDGGGLSVTLDRNRTDPSKAVMTVILKSATEIRTGTPFDDLLLWMGWDGGYSQQVRATTTQSGDLVVPSFTCVKPNITGLCNSANTKSQPSFATGLVGGVTQGVELSARGGGTLTVSLQSKVEGVSVILDASLMTLEILIGYAAPVPGVGILVNADTIAWLLGVVTFRSAPLAAAMADGDFVAAGDQVLGMLQDLWDVIAAGVPLNSGSAAIEEDLKAAISATTNKLSSYGDDVFGLIGKTAEQVAAVGKIAPYLINVISSWDKTSTASISYDGSAPPPSTPAPAPTPTPPLTPTSAPATPATPATTPGSGVAALSWLPLTLPEGGKAMYLYDVATRDDVLVAVGQRRATGAVLRGEGSEWELISPKPMLGTDYTVVGVAPTKTGFTAAGNLGLRRAGLWTTTDGRTWTLTPPEARDGSKTVVGRFIGIDGTPGGGYVVAGRQTNFSDYVWWFPFGFRSGDGSEWFPLDGREMGVTDECDKLYAVATTPYGEGHLIVGRRECQNPDKYTEPVAYYDRFASDLQPELGTFSAPAGDGDVVRAEAVAARRKTAVAGGIANGKGVVWTTTDGVRWSKPLTVARRGGLLDVIPFGERGWVAVGFIGPAGKERASVFVSDDGKAWRATVLPDAPIGSFAEAVIERSDGALVIVGGANGPRTKGIVDAKGSTALAWGHLP